MIIGIEFDNPKCEYFSGSVVSGNVYVQVGEARKIKKVAIDFVGEAKTFWTEEEDKKVDKKTVRVRVDRKGDQKLFEYRLVLLDGPDKIELVPGRYSYRFEYILPSNLPADWEGTYGHIRYSAKAFVDIPWSIDVSCKQQIKIIPNVDLNTVTGARERFIVEKEKTVGMFCCTSGKIVLTAIAPKCGYVCGELIPFLVQIENNSEAEITETVIELKKIIEYATSEPNVKNRSESTIVTCGKWATRAEPNGGQHTLNAPVQVLPTEPTTVNQMVIVKISYEALVTCKISGMHMNLSGKRPIFIGNLPVSTPGDNMQPPPTATTPSSDIGWNKKIL